MIHLIINTIQRIINTIIPKLIRYECISEVREIRIFEHTLEIVKNT